MKPLLQPYEDLRQTNHTDSQHWENCQQQRVPYVSIRSFNHQYDCIFYDVTGLPYDLAAVSTKIKQIYSAYLAFFHIPFVEIEHLLEETYLFQIYVRREHSEFIAQHLFFYLIAFDD